ncbi:heavy metal translocating P-type ATPase [[Clostridium] colinum]|uniref:heavy metal translocating P-type ATPase n=1 Tax=[Clostridium] colinum TaxID=36835 RepID=UPI002024E5D4|nr:heavy metal translocating P-type ATPase [[Clostridium] colinum]
MRYKIKHSINGRIRFQIGIRELTKEQEDILEQYLLSKDGVEKVKIYGKTASVAIWYSSEKRYILAIMKEYQYNTAKEQFQLRESNTNATNKYYKEKMIEKISKKFIMKMFVPRPVGLFVICFKAARYIVKGIFTLAKEGLKVEVLDAIAIGVSVLQKDFKTAGSIMFLLEIGGLLEEWTHKKSINALADSMALNVEKVWIKTEDSEIQIPFSNIQQGDIIVVRTGTMIPVDGVVVSGEGMVNQASLTGECVPIEKEEGGYVYAGTVLEEGELLIKVKDGVGATRYEKILNMIENSEKLKSGIQSKAERLADNLVPYTLAGTVLTAILTRNLTKSLSILMADFSCALKLSMPLAVLSAMKECSEHNITVKGGKFLEAVAEADTFVFDKTGTLTKAEPIIKKIYTFNGYDRDEVLKISACLEEHFPHSIARAVVRQAINEGIEHKEMHTKVEYIVAHGIVSTIENERALIGSYHFVVEDEKVELNEEEKEKIESIEKEYSRLYLAIGGKLAGILCIQDPIRNEAKQVIKTLKKQGFKNLVMMTGDNEYTAQCVAKEVGIDKYFAEVLPDDKANFVKEAKENGHTVLMIGDGINDSPALSYADAGIAMKEGAHIAKEIADITISSDSLEQIVILREISQLLMNRIQRNYRIIIGFNLGLILLGLGGIITPATSALLHNTSTIAIGLESMTKLKKDKKRN